MNLLIDMKEVKWKINGMLNVSFDSKIKITYINSVIYSINNQKIKIICEQSSSEIKFYNDLFKLKLILGSLIRGEVRAGYIIEYECSKKDAIAILQKVITMQENMKG